MSLPSNVQKAIWQRKLKDELIAAGYVKLRHISNTLQGTIYKAIRAASNETVVIKVTDKYLHNYSISANCDNIHHKIQENIIQEAIILKELTTGKTIPKSIVRYIDLLECNYNYYLIQEFGGDSLFEFIVKAHKLISVGHIAMDEWHRVCKVIFKQMISSIEYIHNMNIAHLDISIENFLINDVEVNCSEFSSEQTKIEFNLDMLQIKIIDFGLSEIYNYVDENGFVSNKWVGKSKYKSPEICAKKKNFNSKSNDIWCLGICLFMMLFGTNPWSKASPKDACFDSVMNANGNIFHLLQKWNRCEYIKNDHNIIDLFQSIFQYEETRIHLSCIKKHPWLN